MKALQITGYGAIEGNLAINELEKPSIKDHQVLIEIYAASVNPNLFLSNSNHSLGIRTNIGLSY